jgi:4-alpha-glucanotransferase
MVDYLGADRRRRRVPDQTLEAVLGAMEATGDASPGGALPLFARPGDRLPVKRATVYTESGGEAHVAGGVLPADLPIGYHRLVADGAGRLLVVSPGTCHQPEGPPAWGWDAPLYACRSARSWGIGDAGDLRRLGRWARRQGASVILLNPLSAPLPLLPQETSPYFASSRLFGNPLYIAVDEEPVGGGVAAETAATLRRINSSKLIDRDAVFTTKMRALEAAWQAAEGDRRFDAFRTAGGQDLERFAIFNVLTERFGSGWRSWPARFHDPDSAAVARVATEEADHVGFHAWLEWVLEVQLQAAARETPLMHDVAVGFDPRGADAWANQDLLAPGIRIGAPPDTFNRDGQDWGLPAFDPARLRAAGYAPLASTFRAAMRHGGGVRIDHVLGLFRLWWIPDGCAPEEGAYVRYPAAEMLDVLALESQRARAMVVGEDLGTVEAGVRHELRRRGVLSSRVLWFESRPPDRWPRQAVASMTTHDLPTTAGLWSGSDVEDEAAAGHRPNPGGTARMRRRLLAAAVPSPGAGVDDVVVAAYQALGASPCRLVLASLADASGQARRLNMPGTVESWPNWRIPLPRRLEQLARDRLPARIAKALSQARPAPTRGRSAGQG